MTLFAAQAGVYFDETVRDCKILNDGSLKKMICASTAP